jgi:hypothetical protein
MSDKKAAAALHDTANIPVEPRPIMYIGGPMNGKKMADFGQTQRQTRDGDVYRRLRMDAHDGSRKLHFDIFAYWGKTWEQKELE